MPSVSPVPSRTDALARAAALARRARELRRMQVEVQKLTAHEVEVLARTAASFFDAIPLPEFTTKLLPQSERGLRRIRHRILHRTIHTTATGTLIRALLLGRDGMLRLFSARSAVSRDLLLILEPGRTLPAGVVREVVDWTPMLRVPQFRPFEILEKISRSLDAVEEQIAVAEERVGVQWAALASGDLSALIPDGDAVAAGSATAHDDGSRIGTGASTKSPSSPATGEVPSAVARDIRADPAPTEQAGPRVSPQAFAAEFANEPSGAARAAAEAPRLATAAGGDSKILANAASTDTADVFGAAGLFDMFQRVEHVADAAGGGSAASPSTFVASPTHHAPAASSGRNIEQQSAVESPRGPDAESSEEWGDFEEDLPPSNALCPPHASAAAASLRSMFPVMPAPR
ncbi:MAG: hypothetical protein H7305_12135 [Gemmatimonadaceae bacterium]|nr:hypothetical protein [Gemmatimonadaceae bacterium]